MRCFWGMECTGVPGMSPLRLANLAELYHQSHGAPAALGRFTFSIEEKQIWVIREVRIKAKEKYKKRLCSLQRKSEN
jgi:hypothetical protein